MPRRRLAVLALATLAAAAVAGFVIAALPAIADATGPDHVAHARPLSAQAPGTSAGASVAEVTEQVSLDVRGAGMSVSSRGAAVTLTREGSTGMFLGSLPAASVTDARGSLAGWTLSVSATLPGGHAASIDLRPAAPIAVTGVASEVGAGPEVRGAPDVVLVSAPPGGGGGAFTVPGAAIAVRTTSAATSLVADVHFVLT